LIGITIKAGGGALEKAGALTADLPDPDACGGRRRHVFGGAPTERLGCTPANAKLLLLPREIRQIRRIRQLTFFI